jgi:hypothetical protein
VVARLRERRIELTEAIHARVTSGEFASSSEHDTQYEVGLRAAIAATIEYALDGIPDGEWTWPIPGATIEQAHREAHTGISLELVLRRCVAAHALLGEFVMEEADRDQHPPHLTHNSDQNGDQSSVLAGVLRAQASVLDRLVGAIAREYEQEATRVARSPQRRRLQRVSRLLDGGPVEPSQLGYRLDAWHLGVIAAGTDAAQAIKDLAQGVDRRLLSVTHTQQRVWAWLGGRKPLLVHESQQLHTHKPANEGVIIALGEPGHGLHGWRLTHHQAQAALSVALHEHQPASVTRYADVALLALALKDQTLAQSLIDIYLTPLNQQRDHGIASRETLRAYLTTGCNASSAAATLGVARNTVENRLRTIEHTLNRTLHTYLAELKTALHLEELNNSQHQHPNNPLEQHTHPNVKH